MEYYTNIEEAPLLKKEAVYQKKDCQGKSFGRFYVHGTAWEEFKNEKKIRTYWLVKCSECRKFMALPSGNVVKSDRNCVCDRIILHGPLWKGTLHIPHDFYGGVSRKLKRGSRTLDFDISIDDIEEVYVRQKGVCVYTGLALTFGSKQTASLDRLDSSRGYVKGNIQLVHKVINIMKWDFEEDEFVEMCNLVSKNFNKNKRGGLDKFVSDFLYTPEDEEMYV